MQKFYSNGKLLLSGEYLILDGAIGLALPTTYGQSMEVMTSKDHNELHWVSLDQNDKPWFEASFRLADLSIINLKGDEQVALALQKILTQAKMMGSDFLRSTEGRKVSTKLEFPSDWGLGSSSTLINNIAQWAKVNAFSLLFDSFGGSGYDIACAQHDSAILYQLNNHLPQVQTVQFDPPFKDQIYFVHLNQKQVSRDSINSYRSKKTGEKAIKRISALSEKLLNANNITDFNSYLKEHESILASILETRPVQEKLFPDFGGQTKSLGAWGGDFIMATGDTSTKEYFDQKGFHTVISYDSMIKTS